MFTVKSYFSQTKVSDPKTSLSIRHRVFITTLNNNNFKDNKGIFCLREISFVGI